MSFRAIVLLALVPHAACSPPPNPIVQHDRITLLIHATSGVAPSVTGDFTAWKPQPARPTWRSGWYQFEAPAAPDARLEYLIFFGARDLRVDPRNPRRVPSVGGEASEIVMPDAEAHPELEIGEAPAGELRRLEVAGPGGTRNATIYRPAGVPLPAPIVYFNDGTPMLDSGRVPQILDRLAALGTIRPFIAVFVDPLSRAEDYKGSAAFRQWFVETLVPRVESSFSAPPGARAIVGVSRGATAALDIAWHHPALFARCGLLLPSTSPTDLPRQIARSSAKAVRFSLVTGRYDVAWLKEGQALRDVLNAEGYNLTYREVPEGHNVQTWRAHLDDVLIGLGLGK